MLFEFLTPRRIRGDSRAIDLRLSQALIAGGITTYVNSKPLPTVDRLLEGIVGAIVAAPKDLLPTALTIPNGTG